MTTLTTLTTLTAAALLLALAGCAGEAETPQPPAAAPAATTPTDPVPAPEGALSTEEAAKLAAKDDELVAALTEGGAETPPATDWAAFAGVKWYCPNAGGGSMNRRIWVNGDGESGKDPLTLSQGGKELAGTWKVTGLNTFVMDLDVGHSETITVEPAGDVFTVAGEGEDPRTCSRPG